MQRQHRRNRRSADPVVADPVVSDLPRRSGNASAWTTARRNSGGVPRPGPCRRRRVAPQPPGGELDGDRLAAVSQVQREVGRGAAAVRVDIQRSAQHPDHRRLGTRGGELPGDVGQSAGGCLCQRGLRRLGPPRRRSGQGVQRHAGEHEDVTLRAGYAARGHGRVDVGRRAHRVAVVAADPRDADIREQRDTARGEQDVGGADVAVHDALIVQVGQRCGDGCHGCDDLTRREPAAGVHQLGERAAVREVEHEHRVLRRLFQCMQPDQVRVIEARQQGGFALGLPDVFR